MKKILSLALVGVMALSMIPTALATTDYTNGTLVKYVGTGDAEYTITVPALLAPGGEGDVTLQGTWASDATVKVTADKTVTLTNSINSADQKVLDVTFAGIEKAGDNTATVIATEAVSVADIDNALFGTWSGKFNYNVEMVTEESVENAEPISFTVIGDPCEAVAGITWEEFKNGDYSSNWAIYLKENSDLVYVEMAGEPLVTEDGEYVRRTDLIIADHAYESNSMPSFIVYDHRVTEDDAWEPSTYYFDIDMTWAEWVSSSYNTGAYTIGEYDGTQHIMVSGNYAVYSSDGFVQPSEKIANDISEYHINFMG